MQHQTVESLTVWINRLSITDLNANKYNIMSPITKHVNTFTAARFNNCMLRCHTNCLVIIIIVIIIIINRMSPVFHKQQCSTVATATHFVFWSTSHLSSVNSSPQVIISWKCCSRFLDQELIQYCYSSCWSRGVTVFKSQIRTQLSKPRTWSYRTGACCCIFLHKMTSWLPSWNYDTTWKMWLCRSMHINLKNNPAKFQYNPIWNDGALGFFEEVAPIRRTRWVVIWNLRNTFLPIQTGRPMMMAGMAAIAMKLIPIGPPTSIASCSSIFFFLDHCFLPQKVHPDGLRYTNTQTHITSEGHFPRKPSPVVLCK